jgi:prevent-host-death family protein
VAEAAFNVHQAKTHLSRLLQHVLDGDEIVIAKSGKPIARLVPFDATRAADRTLGELGRTRERDLRFSHFATGAGIGTIDDIDADIANDEGDADDDGAIENVEPRWRPDEATEQRRFFDAG